jgi:hypothetical protein
MADRILWIFLFILFIIGNFALKGSERNEFFLFMICLVLFNIWSAQLHKK